MRAHCQNESIKKQKKRWGREGNHLKRANKIRGTNPIEDWEKKTTRTSTKSK